MSSGPISKLKKKFQSVTKLSDTIREIRLCKTAADEREYVQKECAIIRDYFREENCVYRRRNVGKLLYFYMLGYPAHFGQMECLKLIISNNFGDKKIGYLGIMLLLNDKQVVQLLITNSIKSDLTNTDSPYVVGIAITALANICSADVTRNIASTVLDLIEGGDTYIKKKAILCAVRMVRVLPDIVDVFSPCIFKLINDNNNGVQMATASLIIEILRISKKYADMYEPCIPVLLRNLRTLVQTGSCTSDYTIDSVNDPFLQIKIIEALRWFIISGINQTQNMSDVLTDVITHNDLTSKNSGTAVLYEAITAIMEMNTSSNLRTLAINVMGQFLVNSDPNIKCIALNLLLKVVKIDFRSVQRHRSTILDALRDKEMIVKRYAIELSFAIINSNTVEYIIEELVEFMSKNRDNERLKSDCASGIILVSERHAIDKRWYFRTVAKVLALAGNSIRDEVIASLIQLLNEVPQLQTFATHLLFIESTCETSNFNDFSEIKITPFNPLLKICCWTLGEYGDLLIETQQELKTILPDVYKTKTITEFHILKFIENCLSSKCDDSTKNFIITAAFKLTSRLGSSYSDKINKLISIYKISRVVELQQRSLEYDKIVKVYGSIKNDLLERIPRNITKCNENKIFASETLQNDLITDIDEIHPKILEKEEGLEAKDNKCIPNIQTDILSIFDKLPDIKKYDLSNAAIPDEAQQIYENQDGIIFKILNSILNDKIHIKMYIQNNSNFDISSFNLKIAVPKYLRIELYTGNDTHLQNNVQNMITQSALIYNPNKKKVRLRIQLSYIYRLENITHQFDVDHFT
ncbi:hypothetical protein A3Q56_04539 [Intoshia linei]|uniref:AP-1 complex subunit gamma n=1 Tax=Intoshia linei TaxID=1819745 RepID=A0A177B274_9BILA|nr:hypothetical protein A3Q56_04539 [Intoshia linei]